MGRPRLIGSDGASRYGGRGMSDDGFGPPLRGGGTGDAVDRTYDERWAGDTPSGGLPSEHFGPPVRGRRRRVRPLGVLKTVVSGTLALVVVAVVAGFGLAAYASSRIDRQPVEHLVGGGGSFNVLVVGSDSREGFTEAELQALGTEEVEGRRTDTIFLLAISGGSAAMLSFPRDLYVTGCTGAQARINAAYNDGGPSCLVQTVSAASGIGIDHYVEVNLFGFTRIVDAVGGVPIYLDEPLVDRFAGVDLAAGCQVLDGRQAVGFVRARHVDSDLGRIARQQRFLKELAAQVISPSTLVNVPRMLRVAGAAGDTVTADEGLGLLDLLRVARAARGLAGGGLATYTVPANAANIDGAAVLVPDAEAAESLFARFRDGTVLDVPARESVQVLQPGDVPVRVLNAVGTAGLAAQVRDFLAARGFEVTEVGNTDPRDATVVLHPDGLEAGAQLVADQIPGTTTQLDPSVDQITLLLGPGVDLSAPAPPPMEEQAPADDVPVGAAAVPEGCER